MAKARSRAAARKVKDKWKAKTWYNILAPDSFDNVTVSETLSDDSSKLIKRVTEISLQDITNDFRKSHIKLFFEINNVEGSDAHTQFIGHTLTSDYLRRMIRRKRSKIDGVYDVLTRDGARVRIKPFATTDRRIQTSQKKVIRDIMKNTIVKQARASTLSEFIKIVIEGKIGSDIYKSCKKIYPVKRVEVYKTQVISQPTTKIEEPKKPKTVKKSAEPEAPKPSEAPEEVKEEITEPVEDQQPEESEVTSESTGEKVSEESSEEPEKKIAEEESETIQQEESEEPEKETESASNEDESGKEEVVTSEEKTTSEEETHPSKEKKE